MTWPPGGTTSNFAGGGANIGAQAGVIIGNVYQQVGPNDSAKTKYELGVRYLDGGMAPRALPLIEDAIAGGYESSEVRFHWLLALLSGRTFRQFPDEDVRRINAVKGNPYCQTRDRWGSGSRVIFRFFDSLLARVDDVGVFDDLRGLASEPRDKILRHLDVFLQGPLENGMWELERERAEQVRQDGDRVNRVWMFFVPDPANTRIRAPQQPVEGKRITVSLIAVSLLAAAGYVGWELLWHVSILGLLAFSVSVLGGRVLTVNAIERRYLGQRRQAKQAELDGPPRSLSTQTDTKFTTEVDGLFQHYFRRYVPEGTDRDQWLQQTRGIRNTLCDEMVELYRGSRRSSAQVRWLIKHHVRDVRDRAQNEELWNSPDRFLTSATTEVAYITGGIAFLGGAAWSLDLVAVAPGMKALTVIALLLGGWGAGAIWLPVAVARKRYDAECAEYTQRLADCERALEDWKQKLLNRPTDADMATWLDADQKYLMGQAMQHYKLTRNDVIAHAFIVVPGTGGKRKDVPGGITRHSRYLVHVFLLTLDGVRQVIFTLTFGSGRNNITRRTSYRFDSIASVEVTPNRQAVVLQLVSGQEFPLQVAGASQQDPALADDTEAEPEDDSPFGGAALTPASLANTIHVLEGIAAEGKEWIRREQRQAATTT